MKITTKGNKAWVTFTFTPANESEEVFVLGDWNDWEPEAMKRKKSGEYYLTKVLPCGSRYEYGFRTADACWHTDGEAQCVPSPFGSHNSLLEL